MTSASVGGVVGEGAAELGLEVVDHGSARPSVVGEGEVGEGGRGTEGMVPPAAPAHIGRTERIGRRDPLVAPPDPLPGRAGAAGARDAGGTGPAPRRARRVDCWAWMAAIGSIGWPFGIVGWGSVLGRGLDRRRAGAAAGPCGAGAGRAWRPRRRGGAGARRPRRKGGTGRPRRGRRRGTRRRRGGRRAWPRGRGGRTAWPRRARRAGPGSGRRSGPAARMAMLGRSVMGHGPPVRPRAHRADGAGPGPQLRGSDPSGRAPSPRRGCAARRARARRGSTGPAPSTARRVRSWAWRAAIGSMSSGCPGSCISTSHQSEMS